MPVHERGVRPVLMPEHDAAVFDDVVGGEGPGAAAELFMILHIAAVGIEDGSGGLPHLPQRVVPAAVDLHSEIPQGDLFLRRIFGVPVIVGKAVGHAVDPELKFPDARRTGRGGHGRAEQHFRIQPFRAVDRDAGGGKVPVVEKNAGIGGPQAVIRLVDDHRPVVSGVREIGCRNLLEVVYARGGAGHGTRFLQSGQQHCGENGDDCYHDYDHLLNIQYGVY